MSTLKNLLVLFALILPLMGEAVTIQNSIDYSKRIIEKAAPTEIDYFSVFTGPSLGKANPIDHNGIESEGAINTWTQLGIKWAINDQVSFQLNPRFAINHNPVDEQAKSYEWDDLMLGFSGQWYRNGKFTISGTLNTVTPALRGNGTKEDGLLFNPGGWQTFSYRLDPRWSVGAWLDARYQIFDRKMTKEDDAVTLMLAPKVSYAFNDKFSAYSFYQYNGGMDQESKVVIDRDDSLSAALSIGINDKITVEPMLTVYRENDYDVQDANVGIWLYGKLF